MRLTSERNILPTTYIVHNDHLFVLCAIGEEENPCFCGIIISFQVCQVIWHKSLLFPSLSQSFLFVNDIPHDKHSKRIAIASLAAWLCQFWMQGLALPFPRSLWNPGSQLVLQSGVHTVKELAVDPQLALWKIDHLFHSTQWNRPFILSLRMTALLTSPSWQKY